ncbi:MAG TPA: glucose-6-phosphate dehydrogenase [Puia sp.]|nr:glucose-6-phosphate dehydrogenase [Puia sp.]
MKQEKVLPAAITIFGAKGDLARRKLIPALYNLYADDHLPDQFSIFCVDFLTIEQDAYRQWLLEGVDQFSRTGKADSQKWTRFAKNINYIQGDFMQAATYTTLKTAIKKFEDSEKVRGIRMFYFAVAPRFIEPIADALCNNKLCNRDTLDRIVVEKPFGTDLDSAKKLNRYMSKRFKEKQIYHIDHYLGKEMVQNIMAFRFANYVFEPLWNNKYIDHVQISVAEEVSVGKRGGYYDSSGALRDMIQNHLLQLLCIIAMNCPRQYEAEAIRDEKVKVLKNIRPFTTEQVFKNVVRGQYTAGKVHGEDRPAYRDEEQVAKDSTTETLVAAKFLIDNDRWKGVPFFLRTGKDMPRQSSVIMIQFKDSPHKIFKDDVLPNRLMISIQPELEIGLLFEGKEPGLHMKLVPVEMDFMYKGNYMQSLPEAYEALLLDVLEGDATQFMRADQIEWAWKVVMPIIEAWKRSPKKGLQFYEAGTWGPKAADALLKPHAKAWYVFDHESEGATTPAAFDDSHAPSRVDGDGAPEMSNPAEKEAEQETAHA